MREMTRDFSATSEDLKGKRWELRLLPQPLYRYESTDPDVLDGAVFAFVTSAGTDPEVILVIEARKPPGSDRPPAWHYAIARFSDLRLWVRHKGREVFTAPPIPWDAPSRTPSSATGPSATGESRRSRGSPPPDCPTGTRLAIVDLPCDSSGEIVTPLTSPTRRRVAR